MNCGQSNGQSEEAHKIKSAGKIPNSCRRHRRMPFRNEKAEPSLEAGGTEAVATAAVTKSSTVVGIGK